MREMYEVRQGGANSRSEVYPMYAPRPNSAEEGLDVFSCGNGRRQRLVPIDFLKLDDEGAVVTAIH